MQTPSTEALSDEDTSLSGITHFCLIILMSGTAGVADLICFL